MLFGEQIGYEWNEQPIAKRDIGELLFRIDISGVATAPCENGGPDMNYTVYY